MYNFHLYFCVTDSFVQILLQKKESGLPWWFCGLIRSPVHAAHDYQKGWGSTPSQAGKKTVSCCLACMRWD